MYQSSFIWMDAVFYFWWRDWLQTSYNLRNLCKLSFLARVSIALFLQTFTRSLLSMKHVFYFSYSSKKVIAEITAEVAGEKRRFNLQEYNEGKKKTPFDILELWPTFWFSQHKCLKCRVGCVWTSLSKQGRLLQYRSRDRCRSHHFVYHLN